MWERELFGRVHVFTRYLLNGRSVIVFVSREDVSRGGYCLVRTLRPYRWV